MRLKSADDTRETIHFTRTCHMQIMLSTVLPIFEQFELAANNVESP